jgi:SPX domain protein involved in polyphosphate accumulation
MQQILNKNTPYRYERKFTANTLHRSEIFSQIKMHPAFFREIFHTRQVNNIYFDTPGLKFYNDNIVGVADRKKVRIRWYGAINGKINSPKLEYKIKSGLLGTKWTFDVAPFELNEHFSKKYIADILNNSDLPDEILEDLKTLSPTLVNAYQRTYYLSADQKYRLTVDELLKYFPVNNLGNNFKSSPKIQDNEFILELKYGETEDAHANQISKLFPYRLDKSSKYVNGIELVK